MRTRFDRWARTYGMTRAQGVILARLARQPGMSQNEMAALCEVEPITVGRLVDRLEARGLWSGAPIPPTGASAACICCRPPNRSWQEIQRYKAELFREVTDEPGRTPRWNSLPMRFCT